MFLEKSFAGREYDEQFLSDLPANVDPCGENGEFHSFVYDGPIFRERILFHKGRNRAAGQPLLLLRFVTRQPNRAIIFGL